MQPTAMSDQGIEILHRFEGLAKEQANGLIRAYLCPAGIWTIGYGHTQTARKGMTITKDQADELLASDLADVYDAIERLVTVPLTQNQFDGLGLFIFNLGESKFAKSTLLKKLNKGDYDGAAAEFLRWNKARDPKTKRLVPLKGLTRRRTAEAALFAMDTPLASESGDRMPQAPETVKPKSLAKSRTLFGLSLAGVGTAAQAAMADPSHLSLLLDTLTTQITPLASLVPHGESIATGLQVLGIVVAAYAKIDDFLKGRG